MTRFIVRLRSPWLRIPLWTLWFPLALVDVVMDTVQSGRAARLATGDFWRRALDIYFVGFDGLAAR